MKILKAAKPTKLGKRFLCDSCDTLLLVMPTDTQPSKGAYKDGFYFYCPVCNKCHGVNKDFILPNFDV